VRCFAGLSWFAWVRLAAWTLIGTLIYLFYGVQHSKLNLSKEDSGVSRFAGDDDNGKAGSIQYTNVDAAGTSMT
jgi:hypothetical protein